MNQGPFTSEFDIDLKGVVRREIITYRYDESGMRKETVVRTYSGYGDYTDSTYSSPLPDIRR